MNDRGFIMSDTENNRGLRGARWKARLFSLLGLLGGLAAARLRRIAGTKWSTRRYMNMDLLKQQSMSA